MGGPYHIFFLQKQRFAKFEFGSFSNDPINKSRKKIYKKKHSKTLK